MPPYNTALFDPPAPVDRVTLRNPATGASVRDIPMILDTGADVTLIPRFSLPGLAATPIKDKEYELMSFDGYRTYASAVHLELRFCHKTFRGRFLVIDQAWGILGRNVLNAIAITLDGPNLTWSEKGQDPRRS